MSEEIWAAAQKGLPCEELAELKLWSDSINPKVRRSVVEQKVKTLTINTTQLCNLKCTYCAAGGDGTYGAPTVKIDLQKGLPQLEWLMSRCLPGERFHINFLGGEPLLYPEVMREVAVKAQQLAESYQVAVRFAVVTNGTLLKQPAILELLSEFRMAVTVSVDGPPHVQDRFRPKKAAQQESSSRELERGLYHLREIKNRLPSVGLAAVFHKDHVDVLETYKYFLIWDFDFYEFNYSHTDFDLPASQAFSRGMSAVAQLADSIGGEEELRKIRSFDGIIERLDEQVQLENFCGSGKSLLSMDARGHLYACPWEINDPSLKLDVTKSEGKNSTTYAQGDHHFQGEESVGPLSAERLSEYQAPQIAKNECAQCWARFICGGGCAYTHKSSGNLKGKVDPIFCERTQNLIITTIMYYEKYRRSAHETH